MCSVLPLQAEFRSSGKVRMLIACWHEYAVANFLKCCHNFQVLAEYIWLDGTGPQDLRSKTKVLQKKPLSVADAPVISVDVFPTSWAKIGATEVYLRPRKLFRDPFRGGDHLLVLCDTTTFQSLQVWESKRIQAAFG